MRRLHVFEKETSQLTLLTKSSVGSKMTVIQAFLLLWVEDGNLSGCPSNHLLWIVVSLF